MKKGLDKEEIAEATCDLGPEIEARLPEWRERILEIDQVRQPWAPVLNGLRRDLGREIHLALTSLAESENRTRRMEWIADSLGCSRTLIYNLVNVGAAFPGDLPLQHWSNLAALARLDESERERWLATHPDWAKAKDAPAPHQDDDLTPQSQANRAESRDAEEALGIAREAYDALPAIVKARFLAEELAELDLSPLHPDLRRGTARRIQAAAARVISQVPELAAAAGRTETGPDDSP